MKNLIVLFSFTVFQGISLGQVIISELNDPQSNYQTNRWIEITNISTCDVDLSDYRVIAIGNSTNGSVAAAAGGSCTWNPTGILAVGASATFGGTANTAITPTFTNAAFNNGTTINTNWNGQNRDGVRLEKNNVLVDLAWISNTTGDFFTDNARKRNATVCQGNTSGNSSEWFNGGSTDHSNANAHINTVSWCGPGFTCPVPLPATLLDFKAMLNQNHVELSWITLSEYNTQFFNVERSKDGAYFENVLQVNASGFSTSPKDYFDIDWRPLSGKSYYRLKLTDVDGSSVYSKINVIYNAEQSDFNVGPNPVVDYFIVRGSKIENAEISLYNISGQLIQLDKVFLNDGVKIATTSLQKGVYFVRILSDGKEQIERILIH